MKRYITIILLLLVAMPMPLFSAQAVVSKDFIRDQYDTQLKQVTQSESSVKVPTADMQSTSNKLGENFLNNVSDKVSFAERPAFVPGEVIVKFKENRIDLEETDGLAKSRQFAARQNLTVKDTVRQPNLSVLKARGEETVEQMIVRLKIDPDVEYIQPNYQYYPTSIPTNDTYRANLWGLDNTGQTIDGSYGNITGTDDKDIDAPEAWAINEGTNASVIVAVIDSGVAYNHPDLANNMWDGTSCVKEDGSPLGGCNHGYDYEDSDSTPLPTTSSHGTHIAGTIAAVMNNSKGIIGVAPNAKIMALKSALTTAQNVMAINFAKHNGAKVINASWGDG
ncbi:MAG TPA: S8 family serine peptidase, partial [Patescibacteria group bacterium]|nr:S8 family serine peptidase [Patescibacteria group bacterium]